MSEIMMTKGKKLLFIVGGFPPADKEGGPGAMIDAMVGHLCDLGYVSRVVTTNANGRDKLKDLLGWTSFNRYKVFFGNKWNIPIKYFSPRMFYEMFWEIKNTDFVFISSSWNLYGVLAGLFCMIFKKEYVLFTHGSYHPSRLQKSAVVKKIWWYIFDSRLYANAKVTIAMSEREAAQAQDYGVSAIEVLPIGVSEAVEKAAADFDGCGSNGTTENQYVLFLGRITPIKNIEGTIDFFETLLPRPGLRLLVAGGGDPAYIDELERYAESKGLENLIEFLGPVSESKKLELLRNASLFVLLSGGEGLPQAVLEAMHCGVLPIVSEEVI